MASPGRKRIALASLGALAGFGLLVWALVLTPRGFYSGDSGVKFIQAYDLWEQGFTTRALVEDAAVNPQGRYHRAGNSFERSFAGHQQGIYSIGFVAPAALLIGWFGMAGAQLLPALGGLLCAFGLVWLMLRMRAGPRSDDIFPTITAGAALLFALLGTPILLYSAQFFEHVPAAGFATVGVAAAVSVGPHQRNYPMLAGLAAACAGLLRPEGYCVVSALGLALIVQPAPFTARLKRGALYLAGAVPLLVAFWLFNIKTTGVWDPLVSFDHGTPTAGSTMVMVWGEIGGTSATKWLAVIGLPLLIAQVPRRTFLRPLLQWAVAAVFAWMAWKVQHHGYARILGGMFTVTPLLVLGFATNPWSARTAAAWVFMIAFFAQVIILERGGNGGGLQLGARYLIPVIPVAFALLVTNIEDDVAALGRLIRWRGLAITLAVLPALLLAVVSVAGERKGDQQALDIVRLGVATCDQVARGPGRVVLGKIDWEAGVLAPTLLDGKEIWISRDGSDRDEIRRIATWDRRGFTYVGGDLVDVPLANGDRATTSRRFRPGKGLLPVQYVGVGPSPTCPPEPFTPWCPVEPFTPWCPVEP